VPQRLKYIRGDKNINQFREPFALRILLVTSPDFS
jgi:hypothetical protein